MKRFYATSRLSSGFLAAALAFAIPVSATAAVFIPQLEKDTPQAQTTIKEWHWRDMAF
ncbi:MAG: hypothetical protein AAGI69_25230 [Cyanobacteria bacterium P01_H01_bin.21]